MRIDILRIPGEFPPFDLNKQSLTEMYRKSMRESKHAFF